MSIALLIVLVVTSLGLHDRPRHIMRQGHYISTKEMSSPSRRNGISAKSSVLALPVLSCVMQDVLVNDDNLSGSWIDQYRGTVTTDGNGNFVSAWVDYRWGDADIFVRQFDQDGCPTGPSFRVNQDPGFEWQFAPVVAADGAGNFVVVWVDGNGHPTKNDLLARRFNAQAQPLGPPFKVNNTEWTVPFEDAYVDKFCVDMNSAGMFVITWTDDRGEGLTPHDVYAKLYDGNGIPIGADMKINQDSRHRSDESGVAIDDAGNSIVVWADRPDEDFLPKRIMGQRLDATGGFVGDNFLISENQIGALWPNADKRSDGGFVVTWHNRDPQQGTLDVFAKIYDANGIGSPIFMVNDDQTGLDQREPWVSVRGDGNFVVVWHDEREGVGQYNTYAQRFLASGVPVGVNFKVNPGLPAYWGNLTPACAFNHLGTFLIVWEDLNTHWNYDIGCRSYSFITGDPIWTGLASDEEGACAQTLTFGGPPTVGTSNNGGFVVLWTDARNDLYTHPYAQIFDPQGSSIGTNFRISDTPLTTINQEGSLSVDIGSGNFVVVFETNSLRGDKLDIVGRCFDRDGHPLTASFVISDRDPIYDEWYPSVASMPDGKCVFTWEDHYYNGTRIYSDIYARIFYPDGSPVGPSFKVSQNSDLQFDWHPCVSADAQGNFVIAWMGIYAPDPDAFDILVRRYDANGQPMGDVIRVNDDQPNPEHMANQIPSVAMQPDGSFIVAWIDDRDGNTRFDIFAQLFDGQGNRLGNNLRLNDDPDHDSNFHAYVECCKGGANDFYVVWGDNREPDWDVYVQRVDASGSPLGGNVRVNTPNEPNAWCRQMAPSVANNGTLTAFVWQDNRNAKAWDIYAAFADGAFFLKSDSDHATAFNEQPHLARMPNTENLLVVYQSANKVYFSESYDGGINWELPQQIGDGNYPSIGVTAFGSPCITHLSADGTDLIYKYRDPMMMGWLGFTIFDGNFALRPEQTSMLVHTTAADSVRLAFRVIDLSNEYSFIYYADFPWYETNAASHSQVIDGQLPDYLDRRSPSISADMFDQLHVAWQRADPMTGLGETYYRYRDVLGSWSLLYNVRASLEPSVYPHCEGYGDSVFIHWSDEYSSQDLDVWRAARHVFEFPVTWNYTRFFTPDSSVFPVCAVGEYSVWSEKTNNSNFEIYYWNRSTNQISNLSETPNRSWFGHSNYYQNIMGDPTLYTCWTESLYADAYEVKFRATGGFDYGNERYVCFYSIPVGDSAPSRYTTRRKGRIHWPNRGVWADYDSTALIYKLLCPNPKFLYKVIAVPYQEKGAQWSARFAADNLPIRTVTFNSGTWDTFQFWLPETTYKYDRLVNLRVDRASGEYVPLAYLRVYQFEKKKATKEGGYAQGGTQSAETQPVQLRTELQKIAPNPVAGSAWIRYTLAVQNRVTLRVYDPSGRLVRTLVDATKPSGVHSNAWDCCDDRGNRVPNGVYLVRMETPDYRATTKMVVLR